MAEQESIEELREQLSNVRAANNILLEKVTAYEGPGEAKLYYALNRQLSDLADLINARSLKNVNIDEAGDKTMERMKIVWSAVKSLTESVQALRISSGVTGDEVADLKRRVSFIERIAEKRE